MNAHVPKRFLAMCAMCGDAIDVRQPGVYRLMTGWVKNRSEGGGNAVTLAEKHNEWACNMCIDSHLHGPKPLALF